MIQKAWFEDWFNSPYYHLLYKNRNDDEAQAFIERLIIYLKPSDNARILDVACGKGRHSKVLADLGFDVTGIDLSEASIEDASKESHDKLQFFQHDMRLPFRINYYDYAFNFFTSFGYFKTQREHDNALRSITQSLKHEGIVVIDFLNREYISNRLEENTKVECDDVTFLITKWQDEEHFYKRIEVKEDSEETVQLLYTERVAKFGLDDFKVMLSLQKTVIIAVFGDYNLGEYDAQNSPRLIIVGRKK